MELPDRDKDAPTDPEDRAAFLRAHDLAARFAELAWVLSDAPVDPDDDPEVASSMLSGMRRAARQEVEAALLMLEDRASLDELIELAIIEAIRSCAGRVESLRLGDDAEQEKRSTLEELRGMYAQARRIRPETFAAAVDDWAGRKHRKRARRHTAREVAEVSGQVDAHWVMAAEVVAEALPHRPKSPRPVPGEKTREVVTDPRERLERFAVALRKRHGTWKRRQRARRTR